MYDPSITSMIIWNQLCDPVKSQGWQCCSPSSLKTEEKQDLACEVWKEAIQKLKIPPSLSFEDYVSVDATVETTQQLTESEIVNVESLLIQPPLQEGRERGEVEQEKVLR